MLGFLYSQKFFFFFFGGTWAVRSVPGRLRQVHRRQRALFIGGWTGWPRDANQDSVLEWFSGISQKLAHLTEEILLAPAYRRPLV